MGHLVVSHVTNANGGSIPPRHKPRQIKPARQIRILVGQFLGPENPSHSKRVTREISA